MTVYIEGLAIDNPTATWMQLMNTRRSVLSERSQWNSGAWYETGGTHKSGYTMCLANAIRFVVSGHKRVPKTHSDDYEISIAEQLVLQVINTNIREGKVPSMHDEIGEIPSFNDENHRQFRHIVAAIDDALELLKPHAQTQAITFADDVLTPSEKAEIQRATRKAEDDLWLEWRRKEGRHRDSQGRWRSKNGRFVKVPKWVLKMQPPLVEESGVIRRETDNPVINDFRSWIDGHEDRGWDMFWDELADCGEDKECRQKILALAS